jgi:DNA primase small subunit
MQIEDKSTIFMKEQFKKYYDKSAGSLNFPERLSEREIGYIPFQGSMTRHLSFGTPSELITFLINEVPRSVHYSSGYYHAQKGWKGADLIFDIDTDDLGTPCLEEHSRWICRACNSIGIGKRPTQCSKCKQPRLKAIKWSCPKCLDSAKDDTTKLLDILCNDFGIPREEIEVFFSGSRGYQMARSDIADYVSGRGFLIGALSLSSKRRYNDLLRSFPEANGEGWKGRIGNHIVNKFGLGTLESMEQVISQISKNWS